MKNYRYLFEMAAALAVYLLVLVASLSYLKHNVLRDPMRLVVTLLPVLPCLLVIWTVLRLLSRLDEMQRQIHLQAFAFAFVATALLSFSYGFLENIGFPQLSMFVIWPMMASLWGVGIAIGVWRYR
ncbi:hypothetical protein [Acinetobacter larvae]|uniref:Uncharacterized protein n=1 Tax=Acinetobacter larvae TaxID=1789224 RepID=A0A1B2LYR6_9GAMM|nr:hypothetical protein [Acinetobacter larvae]AOA58029.1 hypothetical protein BFG52_06460 [Acinetobacter larvae]